MAVTPIQEKGQNMVMITKKIETQEKDLSSMMIQIQIPMTMVQIEIANMEINRKDNENILMMELDITTKGPIVREKGPNTVQEVTTMAEIIEKVQENMVSHGKVKVVTLIQTSIQEKTQNQVLISEKDRAMMDHMMKIKTILTLIMIVDDLRFLV